MSLNVDNFFVRNGALMLNVKDIILILFKMKNCEGSRNIEPVFKQLAAHSSNKDIIKFALCDLSFGNNREIVKMSRSTRSAIQATPIIYMYANGEPRAKYSCKTKDIKSLQNFIREGYTSITSQQSKSFVQTQGPMNNNIYGSSSSRGSGKIYKPDIDIPQQTRGNSKQYNYLGAVDEEDPNEMLLPESVIPYNKPWESEYRNLSSD
jgi:hypothetical protein